MGIDIEIDESFLSEILNQYKKYSNEKQKEITDVTRKIGNELKRDVASRSPVGGGNTSGRYKRGWRVKILRNDGKRFTVGVVNSTEQYRLAHLLELGHKVVRMKGGVKVVTTKRTKAIPHIREPQRIANEKLHKELDKIFDE